MRSRAAALARRATRARCSYVEKTVTGYGLAPAGENGGFRQRVPLRNSAVVEDGSAMSVRAAGRTKTLVYGKDFLLGADPLREQVSIEDAPVVFVGYGVSAAGARLRRLRNRGGREGQGGGVPERRAGDAPEQRARVLLIGGGEGGRGGQARRDRHDQLHVAGRSALPLGRERRHRQAGRLRLGRRAGEPQPRRSGAARIGLPQPFRRGGALCRGVEAAGRGLRGGREEHAAGVRPGDPGVARDALDPQGRRERQPRGAPRGQRRRRSRTNTSSTSPTWTTSGAAWR